MGRLSQAGSLTHGRRCGVGNSEATCPCFVAVHLPSHPASVHVHISASDSALRVTLSRSALPACICSASLLRASPAWMNCLPPTSTASPPAKDGWVSNFAFFFAVFRLLQPIASDARFASGVLLLRAVLIGDSVPGAMARCTVPGGERLPPSKRFSACATAIPCARRRCCWSRAFELAVPIVWARARSPHHQCRNGSGRPPQSRCDHIPRPPTFSPPSLLFLWLCLPLSLARAHGAGPQCAQGRSAAEAGPHCAQGRTAAPTGQQQSSTSTRPAGAVPSSQA